MFKYTRTHIQKKNLYTNVESDFTDTHQNWKQLKCSSMSEWINSMFVETQKTTYYMILFI